MVDEETRVRVRRVLVKLPESQRAAFVLGARLAEAVIGGRVDEVARIEAAVDEWPSS